MIEAAKKMRIIGRAGVGVDNIDTKEATKSVLLTDELTYAHYGTVC